MASFQVLSPSRRSISSPSLSVSGLEWAVVAVVGLNLSFLPWAFGGMERRGQCVSLLLAVIGFILALFSKKSASADERGKGGGEPLSAKAKLFRFPPFWAGALLLTYIAIQALNPAFNYESDEHHWWLVPITHIVWLPHGMRIPFREVGVTRALVIWGATWLSVCAVWIGVSRRRSVVALLTSLSINAFIFAAFGVIQRASGTDAIYWTSGVPPYFVAAMVYKNHAGAYFGLLALVTFSLAVRLIWIAAAKHRRSGPSILLVLFFGITALGVVLSCSVSCIVLFGTLFSVVGGITFRRYTKAFVRRFDAWPAVLGVGALGLSIAAICLVVGYKDLRENLERKLSSGAGAYSLRTRWLAGQAGWRMFLDRPVLGWGAGCFCYGFSKYQRAEPELMKWRDTQLRWENVHDDWLELLIETGLCGAAGVGYVIYYWIREVMRLRLWRYPSILPILSGILGLMVYGFFDFPFHNPAITTTAGVLLALCVRWGELEARRNSDVPTARLR